MSTNITAENGASIEVGQLGITVVHPEGIATIYARLTDAQRVELAASLDPGRRGLHVRLDNQAKTLATFQRERDKWEEKYLDTDEALHQARASLDEACKVAQSYKVHPYQATERAEAAERERDKWKARAEAAERDRDDDYSERSQKAAAWDRVAAHPALRMDLLPEADHTYAGGVLERITQLAEAAEARTAPVTRADIEKAIRGKTWAANRNPNKAGFHRVHVDWATDAVCDLFGIEAEQDVDPVEKKARELWESTREGGAPVAEWADAHEDAQAQFRVLARHVRGQESSDE